jgi:hypothetical protein
LVRLKAAGKLADKFGMRSTIDPNLTASGAGLLPFERRRKDRVKVRIPVRIISQGFVDEVSQDGVCTDISESGIAFETNVDLYVGKSLTCNSDGKTGAPSTFR